MFTLTLTVAFLLPVAAIVAVLVLDLRDSILAHREASASHLRNAATRRAVRAARIAKLASIGRDENGALLRTER